MVSSGVTVALPTASAEWIEFILVTHAGTNLPSVNIDAAPATVPLLAARASCQNVSEVAACHWKRLPLFI